MHRISPLFAAMAAALTIASASAQIDNAQLTAHLQLGNDAETRDLHVDGNYVYVARNHLGVDIVDVTNRSNPLLVTTIHPDPNGVVCINDVCVHDDTLYIFDSSGVADTNLGNFVGCYIYDVSNPQSPQYTYSLLWGDLQVPWSWRAGKCLNGVVHEIAGVPYLFVVSQITNGVEVFDVANPAQPAWKAVIDRPLNASFATLHDIAVAGTTLYTCWTTGGYTIHDVSQVGTTVGFGDAYGPQPVTLLTHNSYPNAWASHVAVTDGGSHLCITEVKTGGAMRIFDAQTGVETGSFRGSPSTIPHKPMVRGPLAFVAHFEDGLRVAEITDPGNPGAAAWFDTSPGAPNQNATSQGAYGAVSDGANVFVSDKTGGLYILTVADSIAITKARYQRRTGTIRVHATSTASPAATLTIPGIGTLTWNANRSEYRGTFPVASKPLSVTVESTVGGSAVRSF